MTMWKASGDLGAVPAGPEVPARRMSASTISSAMTACSRAMRDRPAARADPEGDLVGAQRIEKFENDLALGLEGVIPDFQLGNHDDRPPICVLSIFYSRFRPASN